MRLLRDVNSLESVLLKNRDRKNHIVDKIEKIIACVRERGDEALIEYTKKFDKVQLTSKTLKVTELEISSAFNELNSQLISTIKSSMDNVYKFYRLQKPKSVKTKEENGKTCKVQYRPLDRVGYSCGESPEKGTPSGTSCLTAEDVSKMLEKGQKIVIPDGVKLTPSAHEALRDAGIDPESLRSGQT